MVWASVYDGEDNEFKAIRHIVWENFLGVFPRLEGKQRVRIKCGCVKHDECSVMK